MESTLRGPYQGVVNIIRFNWHFYVVASISVLLLFIAGAYLDKELSWLLRLFALGIIVSTCISLLVSYYVYDRSSLYDFVWLQHFDSTNVACIMNVHAGFDETSRILKEKFPSADLSVFDFYDSAKHTEVSIERARKAYPPYEGTVKVLTSGLPVADKAVDISFNIFALHEVRNDEERILFLKEQARSIRDNGRIVVVEHLRDVPNFLAYNIGFLHFLSAATWRNTFSHSGLQVTNRFRITHFVHVFILKKVDGSTS